MPPHFKTAQKYVFREILFKYLGVSEIFGGKRKSQESFPEKSVKSEKFR